jgi:hypothetical protein
MANMSNYLENKLADHLFRTTSYSKPSALYVALFTVTPDDAGGGSEVTGGSYARVQVNPLDTNWTATQGGTSGVSSGTGGVVTNAVEIVFPTPSGNWGTLVAFGIFDASVAGNLLVWGPISPAKVVNNGDTAPKFSVGALSLTFA